MLRASSLGLRCYRRTSRLTASQQWLTAMPSVGLQHQRRAASTPTHKTGLEPHPVRADPYAERAGPPHQNVAPTQRAWNATPSLLHQDWTSWRADLGEEDFTDFTDIDAIPNYPVGNRIRPTIRALSESEVSVGDSAAATHAPDDRFDDPHRIRRKELCAVLLSTDSMSAGWDAYQELMSFPPVGTQPPVPLKHLHRLVRLISTAHPRTRTLFLRLLAVITTIQNTGGHSPLWEWNALLDFAGKGFRRTRLEMYRDSYDVFKDIFKNQAPGTTFNQNRGRVRYTDEKTDAYAEEEANEEELSLMDSMRKPDVWTLTSMFNIATKTRDGKTVARVWSLFKTFDIRPNRVTYLAMLSYYTKMKHLPSVRRVIETMRQEKFELGVDGLNQIITAFMQFQRPAPAEAIYNVLRHNYAPDDTVDIHRVKRYLAGQHILIPPNAIPDPITYMSMLQSYTYYGNFQPALQVFHDMASHITQNPNYPFTLCSLMAYRAFFLGFYRWGAIPPPEQRRQGPYRFTQYHVTDPTSEWTLAVLETMFQSYIALDGNFRPSSRVTYWILMSFARTTGNDLEVLRSVCEQLRGRFEIQWNGRLRELYNSLQGDL